MVYLREIQREIIDSASDWDLALYRSLNGQKSTINAKSNDIESKLCIKAFVEGDDGVQTLEQLRKIKPFKGLHYSNNFVLLIAAATIDPDGEQDNIEKFLALHTYKEQLIINSALGKEFKITTKLSSPIECLAKIVENNEIISEHDIQSCLSSINDLYDLYILETAISRALLQSNEKVHLSTYKELNKICEKVFKRIDVFSFIAVLCVAIYATLSITPLIVSLVVENWDFLEPITYIVDKTITIILLFTGWALTNKIKIIKTKFRKFLLSFVYKLFGVNYLEYFDLVNIIHSNDKS